MCITCNIIEIFLKLSKNKRKKHRLQFYNKPRLAVCKCRYRVILIKKTVAILQFARYVPNANSDIALMCSFRLPSLLELGASLFFFFLLIQSNLGLTDKCGPTTVRCWKKSVKRKRSVPHSVTIVCTSNSMSKTS